MSDNNPTHTIQGLDFVGILTKNAEKARAFWGETLGLQPDENDLMLHNRYATKNK